MVAWRVSFALVLAGATGGTALDGAVGLPARPGAQLVEVFKLGESGTGRAINVWRLGDPEVDQFGRGPDARPAVLIVAGVHGRHEFGTRLALTLIDRIASEQAALLGEVTVYVVANLNPDNDALFDRPDTLRSDFGRAPREVDADRDGRFGEDPADDLNGDGMITMMRVLEPAPGSGLVATLVPDSREPRLMRSPDAEKGEVARYAVLIEGIDNDGDGKFNEDGIAGSAGGGVDLGRNFPSLWPEHDEGAGAYPLSEQETRRLVEWLMTRDNIVCALAFTPADNILNTPGAGKFAPDGGEPTGIEEGDKSAYGKVQEIFKEITGQTGAPTETWEGSFTQYAYAHFGVLSFATPGWVRPELVKAGEAEEGEPEAEPAARGGGEPGPLDPRAERSALAARGIPAFVIDFLLAGDEERQGIMASFAELSEQEQADRMASIAQLPEDVQLRVRSLISGQPDPGSASPAPEGEGGRSSRGREGAPAGDDEDAKWLAYSDAQLGGAGFVPWQEVDHPQLGRIEVGGFVPGLRSEPPESEWNRIAIEQTAFVARLMGMLPKPRFEVTSVSRVAEGLWRVRIRCTNDGELSTRSAIGVKARRIPPIAVTMSVPVDEILGGEPVVRWDTVAGSGAYEEAEWLISAMDGSEVEVSIRSGVFGDRTLIVELTEDDR